MAMPSGNAVTPEKLNFPATGGSVSGGEMQYRHHQWYVDERDGFMSWIRSEFAAANAIIDCLCQHLCIVGEGGEYDMVVNAIQQRRCNWTQVLLMQQYFSVSEVVNALQQVAWRRRQRPQKVGGKEFRRYGPGSRQGQHRLDAAKEGYKSYGNEANSVVKGTHRADKNEEIKSVDKVGTEDDKSLTSLEEKKDTITNNHSDDILKSSENSQESLSSSECEAVVVNEGCISNSGGNDSHSMQNQHQSQNGSTIGKTFIGNEMFDGKMVNVVDGLKLYEDLFDSTEVSKLVSLVNDLRVAGKKGQFKGSQTYVVSKRPMKGHGREMIQLGVPIADAPPDVDNVTASSKDKSVEAIPSLFQDIINRMDALQVLTVKPDACIVDFYNEGDHSQPNSWPPWFGRPVCMLFLTECDMTFGRTIVTEHPGDYRGTFKLSLAPGSLLVMQGKSTDFARRAIPSIHKQRIVVTFTKSQPKKSLSFDAQRHASPATSHWSTPPSRSPNHLHHHQLGPQHYYAAVPATGVLQAPSIGIPPNGMQPLFVPGAVAPPMSFPTPVPIPPGSTGWNAAPPRHPSPRMPIPGTGVFLPPPGSGSSSQHLQSSLTEVNHSLETLTLTGSENGKSNHNNNASASPKDEMDGNKQRQEGNADGTEVEQGVEKEQESN